MLNSLSLLLTFYVGINSFFRKKLYFMGVFVLIYSILFCFVPIINNILIGPAMYHPEALDGIITDIRIYNYYSIINFLYALSIVFVYILVFNKSLKKKTDENVLTVKYNYSYISGCIFIIGVILYIYSTGFKATSLIELIKVILDAGRMAAFQNEGFSSLLLNISFYLMILIAYYSFSCSKKRNIFSILVYVMLIMVTVLMGGRQFIMLALSGYFFYYYYSKNYSSRKVIIFACIAFTFLVMWQILRVGIYAGHMIITKDDIKNVLLSGDFSYFYYASLESIRKYLYNDWLFFGNTYRNLFFMVIPHEWTFGLKQQDLSVYFADAFGSSGLMIRDGNYPPGLIGLFVLNFGFWGWLFVGWPFLFLIYILEFLKRSSIIFVAFGVVYIQLILQFSRGTLMGFYQVFFLIIILFTFITIHYNITKYYLPFK